MRWLSSALVLFCGAVHMAFAETTFERQYGRPDRGELAWDIAEDADGSFAIVGTTFAADCPFMLCDMNGYVVKINPQGDTAWTRVIGSNWTDIITSVIVVGDDYVMTGLRNLFANWQSYGTQVWFLKIDKNNLVTVDKTYGGLSADAGSEIVPTPGGYFIVGSTGSFGARDGKKDVWLLRLYSTGDTLWTRTYDLGYEDMGTSIIPSHNGHYLITAVSCTGYCGGLFQQGFAAYFVTDSVGNVLKTHLFERGQKHKLTKTKPTSDGGAILVGATSMVDNFPDEDIWSVKIDANADTVWTKILTDVGTVYEGAWDVFEAENGGYYVAAYSQRYQTADMNFDNWWLLRLDAAGDTMWTRRLGGPKNDDPYAMIPTSDGGLIMAGWRDANPNPLENLSVGNADFYVIKTDALGMVTGVKSSAEVAQTCVLFQNYPNAFNGRTRIRYRLPRRSYVTLAVCDLLGREVRALANGYEKAGDHGVSCVVG
ncbi:MAG: hypothetical protein ACUVTG_10845, partial [Candidatus Oleimicrobiaceae bacterium]